MTILFKMPILTSQTNSVRAASGTWQPLIKSAIRDARSLLSALNLPADVEIAQAAEAFPIFVPIPFLERMERGNLNDPLLRQVLPFPDEDQSPARFSEDPLGETAATVTAGLLQKYHGRVLLITTGACAVHCRYCFRRHFPYSESPKSLDQWSDALAAIERDTSVEEVILSGGDPLMLVDETLSQLVQRIDSIEHVRRIRFHSRLPIMIPQRINKALISLLQSLSSQLVFVIHSNHANEFDTGVDAAILKLRQCNVTMLNQTVLLRRINDDAETMIQLSQRLLMAGVLPYYLHQLDPITGTSHFEVAADVGRQIIERMRSQLPGYAVPRYVKELAGETGKTVWA
ncbi:MAG: EF-P beta-lysylation protein EpmB [Planctomycetota bacterium]